MQQSSLKTAAVCAALIAAGQAHGQTSGQAEVQWEAPRPAADPPTAGPPVKITHALDWSTLRPTPPNEQGVCPASGYAPPAYGTIVDNDSTAEVFEIASPCNGQEVRDAAQAIGMGRGHPLAIKVLTTARWTAVGPLGAPFGVAGGITTFEMNYLTDSLRLDIIVPATAGKTAGRVVKVVHDGDAWDEASPGVGPMPSPPKDAAAQRAVLLKLTPFGALRSVIEAEGHAVVTQENGKTVITGASPYDNIPVKLTLNAGHQPERAEVKANKHTYVATFADYSDQWEPPYLYEFPARMVWTVDGKPLADLKITGFRNNPYVVFPHPIAPAKAGAADDN